MVSEGLGALLLVLSEAPEIYLLGVPEGLAVLLLVV